MGQTFRIETQRLGRDAEAVKMLVNNMQNNVRDINTEIAGLSSKWHGLAATAFMLTFREDCEKLGEIFTDLTTYCEKMKNAQGTYNRCEKEVGDIVHKI
ncbi:MAG: hypothetical protein Q4B72_09585 [Lachnospiraceae bacterium]|nr:hypothetical protein [Lachnospiraceae bacterium]